MAALRTLASEIKCAQFCEWLFCAFLLSEQRWNMRERWPHCMEVVAWLDSAVSFWSISFSWIALSRCACCFGKRKDSSLVQKQELFTNYVSQGLWETNQGVGERALGNLGLSRPEIFLKRAGKPLKHLPCQDDKIPVECNELFFHIPYQNRKICS